MAGKRTSAAKKAAGIKSKITAKQRIARKKNIEIARKSRKKGRRQSDKMGVENMPWMPVKKSKKGRRGTDKMGVENMRWR